MAQRAALAGRGRQLPAVDQGRFDACQLSLAEANDDP
jgi:hypothetical protein